MSGTSQPAAKYEELLCYSYLKRLETVLEATARDMKVTPIDALITLKVLRRLLEMGPEHEGHKQMVEHAVDFADELFHIHNSD